MSGRPVRDAVLRAWAEKRVLLRGAAIALIYHRVATLPRDPETLCVAPELFDEHIRALSRGFNLVDARELFALLERGANIPRRTVCVTFDDGYLDALTTALPILRTHGAPATVFACSGSLASGDEFWWDELEHLCLAPGTLPSRIDVTIGPATFSADLGDAAHFDEASATRDARWTVTQPPPGPRQRLYLDLAAFIRSLSPNARREALASLRAQTGVPAPRRKTHRPMDAEELRELAGEELVEIGGHTIDHPILAQLPPAEQRAQITEDKAAMEGFLGRELRSFSYPHGGWDDFGAEAIEAVRSVGYAGAFTTRSDVTVPWTDRFRVPRFGPGSIPAEQLVSTLHARFGGSGAL